MVSRDVRKMYPRHRGTPESMLLARINRTRRALYYSSNMTCPNHRDFTLVKIETVLRL
uniref:Uncharacterized protein n=1 Tax=Anguilla anguilla TaxID=7936 RepID=A0A0E9RGJ9_ANGAN